MEIETDKTSMPVPSPGSGVIEEIFVKDGDTVKPGMELFRINITGEAPAKKAETPKAAAPPARPPPPTAPPAAPPKPAGNKLYLTLDNCIITIDCMDTFPLIS